MYAYIVLFLFYATAFRFYSGSLSFRSKRDEYPEWAGRRDLDGYFSAAKDAQAWSIRMRMDRDFIPSLLGTL